MILGDNIFNGDNFSDLLSIAYKNVSENKIATVFGYPVRDPSRYGVIEFDKIGNAISIEEKPKNPTSNYAISGLYFYPNEVIKIAKKQKPSSRGELEITSVNSIMLDTGKLSYSFLDNWWTDAGTMETYLLANRLVNNEQYSN